MVNVYSVEHGVTTRLVRFRCGEMRKGWHVTVHQPSLSRETCRSRDQVENAKFVFSVLQLATSTIGNHAPGY